METGGAPKCYIGPMKLQWSHGVAFLLGGLCTAGLYQVSTPHPEPVAAARARPDAKRFLGARGEPIKARERVVNEGEAERLATPNRRRKARAAKVKGAMMKWFTDLPEHERELLKDTLDLYLEDVGADSFRDLTGEQRNEFKDLTVEMLRETREAEAAEL